IVLSTFVFLWGLPQVKALLDGFWLPKIPVPGLHNLIQRVPPVVPNRILIVLNTRSRDRSGRYATQGVTEWVSFPGFDLVFGFDYPRRPYCFVFPKASAGQTRSGYIFVKPGLSIPEISLRNRALAECTILFRCA